MLKLKSILCLFLGVSCAVASPFLADLKRWRPFHGLVNHEAIPMDNPKVCYDDLGCVEITDDFYDPIHRPVNLLPLPRDFINTRFILHTREAREDHMLYANDPESISLSTFNPSRDTKFIIHGFIDNGGTTWIKKLTTNLLAYGDYNVIVTNWGGGSLPLYTQATGNTRLVGLEIAHLVNTLIASFGADADKIHLIGHSLGAHTAGYAGEKIPGLGRITGLDPAGPYFEWMPTTVRLDPTDAKFVEAIHTDAQTILLLGYGMKEAVAHVDYYVNGGCCQPGCSPVLVPITAITDGFETAGRELFACSHQRSIDFFTDSLTPACEYVAYECADYETYLAGDCYSCGADDTNCGRMGMEGDKYPVRDRTNVMMYLTTGKDAPYCKYHHHVKLALAYPNSAEKWVYGKIRISLYGTKDQLTDALLTIDGSEKFYHGQETSFLFISDVDVGTIQRVELHWNYDATILDPNTICEPLFCNKHIYVSSVEVSEMDHYTEANRLAHTWKSCVVNDEYAAIGDGKTAEFYPTAC